jgi:DNA-binding MarR family transcriptional regulator
VPQRRRTPEGEALVELMLETIATSFKLRAAGAREGAVTAWGGGMWGFLRTLAEAGPSTVPQIARSRPVARQRIQKLADEAADLGLVEFIDNPAHRRSRLVRLTPDGRRRYESVTGRVHAAAERLADGMTLRELRAARGVLRALRERL